MAHDEAFGRGSDESAHYGLTLFQQLGLQLLIVTPLQKIHIIEPFVASVGYVHNEAGRESLDPGMTRCSPRLGGMTTRQVVMSVHMKTLTIKLPDQLEVEIIAASEQEHISKSALVRRALEAYLAQRKSATPAISALDKAGDLVGCFEGGPRDLASNPRHMAGFGKT